MERARTIFEAQFSSIILSQNKQLKDAHISEPLHERSKGCAFGIRIGLYFQSKEQILTQRQPSNLEGCLCVYAGKALMLLAFRAFSFFSAAGIGWINPLETYRLVAAASAVGAKIAVFAPTYEKQAKKNGVKNYTLLVLYFFTSPFFLIND